MTKGKKVQKDKKGKGPRGKMDRGTQGQRRDTGTQGHRDTGK